MSPSTTLAALFALALTALSASADTLTLDLASSGNGAYKYTFTQTNVSGGTELFAAGTQFLFTGLSGVTGASVAGIPAFVATFTDSSATFTLQYGERIYSGTHHDLFTINSSVRTTADVLYSIPTAPVTNGTVQGPVANASSVTPEPSSLILLSTGVVAVWGARRRRLT